MPDHDSNRYLRAAKDAVVAATPDVISRDSLYVVWFCKTLRNWKALISTDVVPGYYYEVTYNGHRSETYVDIYKKMSNQVIPDSVREEDL